MDIQLARALATDGSDYVATAPLTLSKQTSYVTIRRYFAIGNFSYSIVYSIRPGSGFLRARHCSMYVFSHVKVS